jgi:hypothetical protein
MFVHTNGMVARARSIHVIGRHYGPQGPSRSPFYDPDPPSREALITFRFVEALAIGWERTMQSSPPRTRLCVRAPALASVHRAA